MRALILVTACVVALPGTGASAPKEPYLLPRREISSLEAMARQLARKGRGPAVREIVAILRDCDVEDARLQKLQQSCDQSLSKAAKRKKKAKPDTAAARSIGRIVKQAERALGTAEGDERTAIARIILRLDGSSAPAHETLGHARREGRWISASVQKVMERRLRIGETIQGIRRLPVEITTGPSDIPALQTVYGRKGIRVKWKNLEFHSAALSEEKLRRMLREVLRACAVTNFLCNGKAEPPQLKRAFRFAFTREVPRYEDWVRGAMASGKLSKQAGDHAMREAWFRGAPGLDVYAPGTEAALEASVLYTLWWEFAREAWGGEPQPALGAGHAHWVCMRYLGTGIPTFRWVEVTETTTRKETQTGAKVTMTTERKEMEELGQAGIRGLRSRMIFLARLSEDPPFRRAMLDQVGKVQGDELLKATTMVEFLHETNAFVPLAKATLSAGGDVRSRAAAFEKALKRPLTTLEAEWRAWLLPVDDGGLLEQLGGAPRARMSPEDAKLLAHLDKLRLSTLGEDKYVRVKLDEGLSVGARAHAEYLNLNPAQMAAWPDAHEEFADKKGFSTLGNWAGQHSVIAPGSKGPVDAIDGWMGTFYHRLPLLNPGLLRVGWAIKKGTAVLDSGSLVRPVRWQWVVPWPPHGAKDVPIRFNPELPNPVPGADQSQWGYPITLQCFGFEPEFEVQMRLFRGKDPVDAFFSTPEKPTNPNLVPRNTYCLIPKNTLSPNTEYRVSAKHPETKKPMNWKFRTGR
ncbi:MAG: CAP domain-containing protein [Planctomycetota bacterium]